MTDTASENQNPLVSIIVITYNSAKYVLETLESAKAQTYQNIELIVTDDCSTDNTIEICRNWLAENNQRFVQTKLITVEQNTGIPANCNRGLYAAKGEWIKYIAGDDILMPDCIKSFVAVAKSQPDVFFFTCGMYSMKNEIITEEIYADPTLLKHNADEQFKWLATFFWLIPAPTTFMKKNVLIELHGFDENYKSVEDFPLYIKITASGYRFHFIEKLLIIYRMHEESISRKNGGIFLSESLQLYYDNIFLPLLHLKKLFFLRRHYLLYKKLINAASKWERYRISWWMRLTDPYIWLLKYHKIFHHRAPFQTARQKQITPIHKIDCLGNSLL